MVASPRQPAGPRDGLGVTAQTQSVRLLADADRDMLQAES